MHPAIEKWLAEAAPYKSQRTLANARHALQAFVTWYGTTQQTAFDPEAVTDAEVAAWQQVLSGQYAPKTVNLWLSSLSRFLAESGYGVFRLKRQPNRPVKPRRDLDLDRLLAAIDPPRDRALVLLFAGAGLRVGELLQMRIGDLVGDDLTLRGRHARRIKLAEDVQTALAIYLAEHPAQDDPDAWVWVKRNGNRIVSPSGIYRLLNRWAQAAGLEKVSSEDLRRLFKQRYLAEHPNDWEGLNSYIA